MQVEQLMLRDVHCECRWVEIRSTNVLGKHLRPRYIDTIRSPIISYCSYALFSLFISFLVFRLSTFLPMERWELWTPLHTVNNITLC